MYSYASLSSISSTSSSNSSSTYGSRDVLDVKDLPAAPARCRSSIVSHHNDIDVLLPLVDTPPPCPPRRHRRSQVPRISSTSTCCQIRQTSFSLTSTPRAMFMPTKLTLSARRRYFTELSHRHRLLLVLNDYDCRCGCLFSMRQGNFVILSDMVKTDARSLVTVISTDLVCSKVPTEFVCDVDSLRQRVRARQIHSDELSFDL
jgi:hypothetical protein